MKTIRSLSEITDKIKSDTNLQALFKEDPVKASEELKKSFEIIPNTAVYKIVVGSLGLAIILVIIGVVILGLGKGGAADTNIPTIFTAIASGAVGALAGLLAPNP